MSGSFIAQVLVGGVDNAPPHLVSADWYSQAARARPSSTQLASVLYKCVYYFCWYLHGPIHPLKQKNPRPADHIRHRLEDGRHREAGKSCHTERVSRH